MKPNIVISVNVPYIANGFISDRIKMELCLTLNVNFGGAPKIYSTEC